MAFARFPYSLFMVTLASLKKGSLTSAAVIYEKLHMFKSCWVFVSEFTSALTDDYRAKQSLKTDEGQNPQIDQCFWPIDVKGLIWLSLPSKLGNLFASELQLWSRQTLPNSNWKQWIINPSIRGGWLMMELQGTFPSLTSSTVVMSIKYAWT